MWARLRRQWDYVTLTFLLGLYVALALVLAVSLLSIVFPGKLL